MNQHNRRGGMQSSNTRNDEEPVLRIHDMRNANFMVGQMINTDSAQPLNFPQDQMPDPPRLPRHTEISDARNANLFVGQIITSNTSNQEPAPPPQHYSHEHRHRRPGHSSYQSSQQHWPSQQHPSYPQPQSQYAPHFQPYSGPIQERTSTCQINQSSFHHQPSPSRSVCASQQSGNSPQHPETYGSNEGGRQYEANRASANQSSSGHNDYQHRNTPAHSHPESDDNLPHQLQRAESLRSYGAEPF